MKIINFAIVNRLDEGDDMKYAIFVIDMLKEFIEGSIPAKDAKTIIPNIKTIVEKAHDKSVPVFYLCDAHEEGDPELKIWGPHAMKGSEGAKVVDELTPKSNDIVIEKRTYTGFFNTPLDEKLKELGVSSIIMTGIHTHICVQHSAADAFYRGYDIIIVEDATAAATDVSHKQGLETMKSLYGAKIMKTEDVLQLFK